MLRRVVVFRKFWIIMDFQVQTLYRLRPTQSVRAQCGPRPPRWHMVVYHRGGTPHRVHRRYTKGTPRVHLRYATANTRVVHQRYTSGIPWVHLGYALVEHNTIAHSEELSCPRTFLLRQMVEEVRIVSHNTPPRTLTPSSIAARVRAASGCGLHGRAAS